MEPIPETDMQVLPVRPRIVLAASGCVTAIKFENLCHSFIEWGDVKAVATKPSLQFIDKNLLPTGVILYTDDDEWSSWKKIGDTVLHIELRKWADILVIAPLSANTLAKIAGGLCDNLLSCIVRAWDYSKPLYVVPSMNASMLNNPFTGRQLKAISELGISLLPLALGEHGSDLAAISNTVRLSFHHMSL